MESATKQAVVEALMRLLNKKAMDDISISELAKEAGISRMTFYRNYQVKEDVLLDHFKSVLEDYKKDNDEHYGEGRFSDRKNIVHCFEYFAKHKQFLEAVLKSGYYYTFLAIVDNYVMETWMKPGDGMEKEYRLHAFAGALFNVYISWVTNGYKETPEEIADILQ